MRIPPLRAISACLTLFLCCIANAHGELSVIPTPTHVAEGTGSFALRSGGCIIVPDGKRARWIGEFLRRHILQRSGVELKVGSRVAGGNHCIRLEYDKSITEKGAYKLDITPDGVVIAASDNRGLFWGAQTLRQVLDDGSGQAPSLKSVQISDAPFYHWRGLMLDVARTFYPLAFLEKQISLMSYYKLNVLHLHLTDDQGWRLRIKKYPRLTSVGGWRVEPNGARYGGFYTQSEMRELVRYAADRNVMIVPEIEMPGHTSAAIAAYPKLACNALPIMPPTTLGTTLNSDCVGNEYTYHFLERVLQEVAQIFPSPYIHIGTDEVPSDSWVGCKSCADLARTNGFSDDQKDLQAYFVRRITKYLGTLGKTAIGWDEALQGGGTPKGLIVEAWRKSSYAVEALQDGNRVIVAWPFYLSTPIRYLTLRDTYENNPFQGELLGSGVLGGEAALWTNHPPDSPEARVYPRLLAIAEHLWSPRANDWSSFEAKLPAQSAWLRTQGIAVGPSDVDVARYRVTFIPGEDRWGTYNRWRIRAYRGFDNMNMRYTLGGATPASNSPSFTRVLQVKHAGTVTVAPFVGAKMYQAPVRFEFVDDPLLAERVQSTIRPESGELKELTDGILGGADGSYGVYSNSRWVVWTGKGTDLQFRVPTHTQLHTVDIRFLQDSSMGAWVPQRVEFSASADGVHWTRLESYRPALSYAERGRRQVIHVKQAIPPYAEVVRVSIVGQTDARRNIWIDEVTLQ